MNLVTLIVIMVVAYVGWQYLQTFKVMVDELREMRTKCMGSPSPNTPPQSSIKETLIHALEQMKQKAK
jgi:hypothetical protein